MEFEFNFLNGLRTIVTVLAGCVLAVLTVRYGRAFRVMAAGPRYLFAGAFFLLVTVSWDTVNLMILNAPFSWRMLPLIVGLTLCLIYLVEPHSAFRKRVVVDPLAVESEEVQSLRASNEELKSALYGAISRENATHLKYLALETINENLKETRRVIRQEQDSTDRERAGVRLKASEGIERQNAEDLDSAPFEQLVRDHERAEARHKAQDEIDKQDEEDAR